MSLTFVPILGLLINLIGAYIYIRDMFKGGTTPLRLTWLLWSLPPFIATFIELHQGVTWAVLPVFASGFGPALVFLASFFTPTGGWKATPWDYACGVVSVLAIVLWCTVKSPVLSVGLSIAADATAGIPTLKKLYLHPKSEIAWAYLAGVLSALSAFAVIQHWSFVEISFPIYLVVLTASCTILGTCRSTPRKVTVP